MGQMYSIQPTSLETMGNGHFTPRIPFDVLCCIVNELDDVSLVVANLVNKTFHEATNRRLWGTVTLMKPRSTRVDCHAVIEICEAIQRHPQRAACVRTVKIHADHCPHSIACCQRGAHGPPFEAICRALVRCTKLRELHIVTFHHRGDFARQLAKHPFKFELETMLSSVTTDDGLLDFLSRQTKLRAFSLFRIGNGETQPVSTSVPPTLIPSLHTLHASSAFAALVLQNRAVQIVDLTDIDFVCRRYPFPIIIPVLSVVRLTFYAWAPDDTLGDRLSSAVSNLAQTFPNLEYLHIYTRGRFFPPYTFFSALSAFQYLQEIEWADNTFEPLDNVWWEGVLLPNPTEKSWPEAFIQGCSWECASISTISITTKEASKTWLSYPRVRRRSPSGEEVKGTRLWIESDDLLSDAEDDDDYEVEE